MKHKKQYVTLAAGVLAVLLLSGCAKDSRVKGQTASSADITSGQVCDGSNAVTEVSSPTKNQAASSAEEGTLLDFSADSIFGGIEVETDENGELVYTEQDGAIWCRITDKRFGSYQKFSRFVRKSMTGKKVNSFLNEANEYFITNDGHLYFVNGAGKRTISSTKRYVMDGGATVRLTSEHTAECENKYGFARSSVEFVKDGNTWKLYSLRNV